MVKLFVGNGLSEILSAAFGATGDRCGRMGNDGYRCDGMVRLMAKRASVECGRIASPRCNGCGALTLADFGCAVGN